MESSSNNVKFDHPQNLEPSREQMNEFFKVLTPLIFSYYEDGIKVKALNRNIIF